MAIQYLRPASTNTQDGNWTLVGGATVHAVTSDSSNATYAVGSEPTLGSITVTLNTASPAPSSNKGWLVIVYQKDAAGTAPHFDMAFYKSGVTQNREDDITINDSAAVVERWVAVSQADWTTGPYQVQVATKAISGAQSLRVTEIRIELDGPGPPFPPVNCRRQLKNTNLRR